MAEGYDPDQLREGIINGTKDELPARVKAMGDALKKENIHVSAGIACRAYGCTD